MSEPDATAVVSERKPGEPTAALGGLPRRVGQGLVRAYLEADPRALGAFRISLGIMLCFDVARRFPNVSEFYSNAGWLPNHFALFRPMSGHLFSIYHAFSSPGEVKLLLGLHFALAFCLLVGWRTRLMHVLCLVLTTSLNSRNIALENGGWVMVNLITLWSVLLPLGKRFSVDSVISDLRSRERQAAGASPAIGFTPRFDTTRVLSLAVLAILLQWVVVYYFNAVHKSGPSWRDGTAIYYFIHQDRLTQALGIWLRGVLPLGVTQVMTHAALIIEYALAGLLLTPLFYRPARLLAWVLGVGLHVGIGLFASLGPFVWVMLVPYPLFVAREYWDRLEAALRARRPACEVKIREELGGASLARLVLALDTLGLCRVSLQPELRPGFQARLMPAAPTEPSAEPSGRAAEWETGGRALQLVSVGWLLPRAATAWFGWPAVRSAISWLLERLVGGGQLERGVPRLGPGPLRLALGRFGFWVHQAALALMLFAAGLQVLAENRAVPAEWKPKQRPAWLEAMVVYPRLYQGWSMFAPDPPREDGRVIVDGRTVDGRKLDPLTGKAPSFTVARAPDTWNDGDWAAFHTRIPEARFAAHYPALRELLLRHHELTGRPEDKLVAFEIWYGTQGIPPPGAKAPPPRFRRLLQHGRVVDPGVPREHVGR